MAFTPYDLRLTAFKGGNKCPEVMEQALPGEAGQEAAEEGDKDEVAVQVQEEWEVRDPGPARAASVSARSADRRRPISLLFLAFR